VLAALTAKAKGGQTLAQDEARLVRDGKVTVRLWLNDASDAVLAQLKALGFEVTAKPDAAKVAVGRIAVARLEALAALGCVRYVEPAQGPR